MSLPWFFCIIRFLSRSLLLFIQTLSYSIHFHVAVLHKVLAQFWLGCLTQPRDRILVIIFQILSFLQTIGGDVCSSGFFPSVKHSFSLEEKKNPASKQYFSVCPMKEPFYWQRENEGEGLVCFCFSFKMFGFFLHMATTLILWCLEHDLSILLFTLPVFVLVQFI